MISIRPFRETDTDEVMDIWYDVTVHDQSFVPRSFWNGSINTVRNDYLPIARTWVAVDSDQTILGFIALIGDLIGGLFVRRSCQSRGIGGALAAHVIDQQKPVFVDVFQKNHRARSFYRRLGFREIERFEQEETGEIVIKKQFMGGQ